MLNKGKFRKPMEDSHLQKGWIEPRKMVDFIREKSGWSYSYPSENMKVTWDDDSRNMEKTKQYKTCFKPQSRKL